NSTASLPALVQVVESERSFSSRSFRRADPRDGARRSPRNSGIPTRIFLLRRSLRSGVCPSRSSSCVRVHVFLIRGSRRFVSSCARDRRTMCADKFGKCRQRAVSFVRSVAWTTRKTHGEFLPLRD